MDVGKVTSPLSIPSFHVTNTFSGASLLTIFSTAVQFIGAQPGYFILPWLLHWQKAAGAFTLNGQNRIGLRYTSGAGTVAINIDSAGFMDQAAAQTALSIGPGNVASSLYGQFQNMTSFVGVGLFLKGDTADMSVAGGDIRLTLYYRLVPAFAF